MITRIYADNFRCLVNFEFQPERLNLLLGENGSGKTTLFEVLARIRDLVVDGRSVADLFAFQKTVWDSRETQSFELEVAGLGGVFLYRLEVWYPPQEISQPPRVKAETLLFDGRPLFRYLDGQAHLFDDDHKPGAVFPFKPARSFLPNLETQDSKLQWFKQFLARVHIFQFNPWVLDPFSQRDDGFLSANGSNFVSWLRYLSQEQPEAKLECERRLAEIIPGFLRFKFRTAGDRKFLLADFVRRSGEEYQVGLLNLSEGQRILAILYSVLYGLLGSTQDSGPPPVLCFDEPENFISLAEVQPWLQELRDLVEEKSGQTLLISHHPEVIDYLAVDSAFRFERPNGDLTKVDSWIPDPGLIMKPSEILVRGD